MPELITHPTPIFNTLPPSLYAVPTNDPPAPSTPPTPTVQGGAQGVAVPPIIDPAAWEDYPAFRETFLMYFTPPGYAVALRTVGEIVLARRSSGPGKSIDVRLRCSGR